MGGMPPPTLGGTLRAARVRRQLTLREVAQGTGLSYSTLSSLETGRRDSAPLDALLAVGRKLGLSESEISRLAGGLSPEGVQELIGPRLHGALRGGRLSPEAMTALRRVHVSRLLEPLGTSLANTPVDL